MADVDKLNVDNVINKLLNGMLLLKLIFII